MSKRRMPNIVHQRQRFDQICVQSKLRGNRSRNLRDFNRMRQPVTKMIGVPPGENLGLCLEPPKCASMHDAIAVALEVIAIRMWWLWMTASARLLHAHRIVSKHAKSLAAENSIYSIAADRSARERAAREKCGPRSY
jgi:hypothetical protein